MRLGEYTFDQQGESPHVDFKVQSMKAHESYDTNTYVNDIAIVTLDGSTDFSNAIWPVCLPEGDNSYVGQSGTVIGECLCCGGEGCVCSIVGRLDYRLP